MIVLSYGLVCTVGWRGKHTAHSPVAVLEPEFSGVPYRVAGGNDKLGFSDGTSYTLIDLSTSTSTPIFFQGGDSTQRWKRFEPIHHTNERFVVAFKGFWFPVLNLTLFGMFGESPINVVWSHTGRWRLVRVTGGARQILVEQSLINAPLPQADELVTIDPAGEFVACMDLEDHASRLWLFRLER